MLDSYLYPITKNLENGVNSTSFSQLYVENQEMLLPFKDYIMNFVFLSFNCSIFPSISAELEN
jgi:hypothetical protein